MKLIFAVCLLFALPLHATDLAREQRWIDQTVDTIFDGNPVFLNANGHEFLGIYTEAAVLSNKGMIVLHGTGFHPDWDQVVRPVRVTMTTRGWNTLSIQLPLLEKSAAYEDYVALYPEVPVRIDSALRFLRARDINSIVIVAHSQGETMASYYLANYPNDIQALVAIGMSAQHVQPEINTAESLKKIAIPVLDIYGSRDFPTVLETAERRRKAGLHNEHFEQTVIKDAYHFFDDTNHEKILLDNVAAWLDKVLVDQ